MLRTRDRGFHQGTLRGEARHRGFVDRPRPAELDRQTRGFTDGDQRPSRGEERGERIDARLTEAAGEILGLTVHAEELVRVVLEIRLRACGRCLHDRLPAHVLLSHQDHVVVTAQIALHHALFVDQVKRDLELVERETIPPQVLRATPLRIDRDARHIGIMHGNRRHSPQHGGGEPERIHQRAHARRILAVDDERAGRERRVASGEALFGHLHRHRAQQIAQGDHVVRAGMRHGDGRSTAAARVALEHDLVDRRDRGLEDAHVGDLDDVHIHGESHRPAAVVVRVQARVGILLAFDEILGETAIRLIALDDIRAGGIGDVTDRHRRSGLSHFDALHTQQIHELRHARHVTLQRNHEPVRRLDLALFNAVARLDVEVLEHRGREHRRQLQRRQHARLHVVRIRATRERGDVVEADRITAVPLAILRATTTGGHRPSATAAQTTTGRRRRRRDAATRVRHRRAVEVTSRLRLVHLHETVVVVRDRPEIPGRPAVHERMRVHAGHAPFGHLCHFPVAEPRQLGEQDRIQIRILRRATRVRVQQWLRFMQIVHDRRIGREVPFDDRAHLHQLDVDVAIVVVVHVLAPVRHTGAATKTTATAARGGSGRCGGRSASRGVTHCGRRRSRRNHGCDRRRGDRRRHVEPAEEPIHVAIAAIRVGGRRHRDIELLADLTDQRRGLGDQTIRQFHQHFRRTGFTAVQAAHEVVMRLRIGQHRLDLGLGHAARVGDLREVFPVAVETLHVRLGRDPDHHQFATFIRAPDGFDLHARRRGRECTIVLQLIGIVRELPRRADVVAQHIARRRDTRHQRQVIHQRAAVLRIGQPLLVVLGERRILLLIGIACFGRELLGSQ